MSKNTAVFGIYPNRIAVEEGTENLRRAGFRSTDISVLVAENQGTKDFAHEKNTKAPEGAAGGVLAGVVAGGVFGLLTGIGAIAIPGMGPLLAAGPLVAALAGAGAAGTIGGIVGALAGLGVPEYEARRYEGRIREGGLLVSVHCDDHLWVKRATEIMTQTGAQDVAATAEVPGDFANDDKPHPRLRTMGLGAMVTDPPLYEIPVTRRNTDLDETKGM